MSDNPQFIIPAFQSPPLRERVGWKRAWLPYGPDNTRPRWIYKSVGADAAQVAAEIWQEVGVENELIHDRNSEDGMEIPLLQARHLDPGDSDSEAEVEIPVIVGGLFDISFARSTRYLVWDFGYEAWTVCPFHTPTAFLHRKYLARVHGGLSSIEKERIEQTRDYHAYTRQLLPRLASSQFVDRNRKRPCVASFDN